MTAELDIAVNEIQHAFKAAWDLNSGAVFGYVPDVEWYGNEKNSKVDRAKAWARFSTQNVFEEQATLSTCVEQPFSRRYEASGLIFVQLFLPKTIDNALIEGRKLAKIARNAFRGKKTESGVSFHNARIVDLSPEELFYRLNVVVEYDFDDIG